MSKLKIIHTADFHLGVRIRGTGSNSMVIQKRDKDFINQLRRIRDYAIENNCDFLIIAGDVFHSLRPSGLMLNEFSKFIASLAEKDIYTIVVAGNHDQPRTTRTEAYLKAIYEARAPKFYYIKKPRTITLKGLKSGRKVKFICLPYLPPMAIEQAKYVKMIDSTLNRLLESNSEYDYAIVIAHFYIEGAKVGIEKSYLPIYDVALPKNIFMKNQVSYTALGHVHYYQEISKSIVYSGSIERMNFGEEDENKGIVLIEEIGGELKPSFIELPCRPLITLPREKYGYTEEIFDLTGAINPTQKLIELISKTKIPKGAILRLKVKLPYGRSIDRSKISQYMKNLNILHWIIEPHRIKRKETVLQKGFKDIKEAFKEYVEKIFIKKQLATLPKEILEIIIKEGLKIIEDIERGEPQ